MRERPKGTSESSLSGPAVEAATGRAARWRLQVNSLSPVRRITKVWLERQGDGDAESARELAHGANVPESINRNARQNLGRVSTIFPVKSISPESENTWRTSVESAKSPTALEKDLLHWLYSNESTRNGGSIDLIHYSAESRVNFLPDPTGVSDLNKVVSYLAERGLISASTRQSTSDNWLEIQLTPEALQGLGEFTRTARQPKPGIESGSASLAIAAQRERGERFLREGSVLWEAASAKDRDPKLITGNLRQARSLLHDVRATLEVGKFLEFAADSYVSERRQAAIVALRSLDLPTLLAGVGAESDLSQDIEGRIECLGDPSEDWSENVSTLSDLLGDLEAEVSDLLKQPDWRSPTWRERAETVLRLAGKFLNMIGTALAAAAGSVFALGESQSIPDDAKAVTACLITAGCVVLQRDVRALWRQPPLSPCLNETTQELYDGMASLRSALTEYTRNNIPRVAAAVLAVQRSAYWVNCLAQAADNWPDGGDYCTEVTTVLNTCHDISTAYAAADRDQFNKLIDQLKKKEKDLNGYRVPMNLQLRPGARLRLVARILTQIAPGNGLQPAIGVESTDEPRRPHPDLDLLEEDSGAVTRNEVETDTATTPATTTHIESSSPETTKVADPDGQTTENLYELTAEEAATSQRTAEGDAIRAGRTRPPGDALREILQQVDADEFDVSDVTKHIPPAASPLG